MMTIGKLSEVWDVKIDPTILIDMPIKFKFKTLPVYRKLKDDSMNQFFTFLRSRHGGLPTRDKDISNTLLSENKNLAVAPSAKYKPTFL